MLQCLPEVYSLLLQSSVTTAAEEALQESELRMKVAQVQLEADLKQAKSEMDLSAAESRQEVRSMQHNLVCSVTCVLLARFSGGCLCVPGRTQGVHAAV
jgi:hypothetical protein